jgi:hypothetical protein
VRALYAKLGTDHPTRNICEIVVNDGLLQSNPCKIERIMNAPRKREPVILSIAELAAVVEKITNELKALVLQSAWCGPWWGEVTELRRKDMDRDCEVVYLRAGHDASRRQGRDRHHQNRHASRRGGCRYSALRLPSIPTAA